MADIIIGGETAGLLQEIWQAEDAGESWGCFAEMLCEFFGLPADFPLVYRSNRAVLGGTAGCRVTLSADRGGLLVQLLAPLPADFPALPEGASWA